MGYKLINKLDKCKPVKHAISTNSHVIGPCTSSLPEILSFESSRLTFSSNKKYDMPVSDMRTNLDTEIRPAINRAVCNCGSATGCS